MTRRLQVWMLLLTWINITSYGQTWTALNGPYGGSITDLERDGAGNTYAIVSQVLYKSSDNGANWQKATIASPASFYVNDLAIANGKFYAVYYGVFYTSTDAATWTKTATTFPFSSANRVLKFGPDGFIAVYGYDGIFVSKDEGATWTAALIQPDLVYYNGYERLVATSNGDLHTIVRNPSFYNNQQFQIKKYPYPGTGGTYNPSNWQVEYSSVKTGTVTATTASATVTGSGTSFTTELKVGSVLYAISGTTSLYLGTISSIANNTQLTLSGNAANNATALPFTDASSQYSATMMSYGSNVYLVTGSDLLISQDAGSTWPSIKGNITEGCFWGYGAVSSGGTVYYYNGCNSKVYSITNPTPISTTWTINSGATFSNYGTYISCFAFIDTSNLLVGTGSQGVFKSSDAAATFTQSSKGIFGSQGKNLVITNSGGKIIYVNSSGTRGYWQSVDFGTTWTFTSTANYYYRARKLADGTILLFGGSYVAKSTDNMTTISEILQANTDITEASDGTLFAVINTSLYTSADKGSTWSTVTVTGWPSGYNARYVTADASNVYVSVQSSGYKMLKIPRAGGAAADLTNYPATTTNGSVVNTFFAGNTLVVAHTSLMYTSADQGSNWTSIGFSGNAVFPISDGTTTAICVSKSGSFYISQDGGNSWNNYVIPYSNSYITGIDKDPASTVSNPVYYASAYLSPALKFAGKLIVDPATLPPYINFNWQPLNGPYGGSPSDLEIHTTGNLFAITGSRIFKNTGTSWSLFTPSASNGGNPVDIEIDPSGNIYILYTLVSGQPSIYVSTDGGTSWTSRAGTFTVSTTTYSGLKMEKMADNSLVVLTSQGRIFRSTNDGASFTNVSSFTNSTFSSSTPILKAASYAAIQTFSGGSSSDGVLISTDNGATWNPSNTGLPIANGIYNITNLSIAPSGDILVTIAENYDATKFSYYPSALYRSTNQGASWSKVTTPDAGFFSKRVMAMPNGDYLLTVNSSLARYKSTDQGATWTTLPGVGDAFSFYEKSGTDVYVRGSTNGILKSADNGTTITEFNVGLPRASQIDVKLLNNKDLIVASSQPFHSSDFGQSWTRTNDQSVNRFLIKGDSVLSVGRYLMLSTDYGSTWTTLGSEHIFSYMVSSGKSYYAASNSYIVSFGLFFSNDLINWTPLNISGLPAPGTYNYSSIAADPSGTIYAVITESGIPSLYRIAFEVATKITSVITPVSPRNVIYYKGKIYVYDSSGSIYETGDGGDTWQALSAPTGNLLTISNDYLFITGSNGVLWLSRNAGSTWQSVGETLAASAAFQDVIVNEYDGYAYGAESSNVIKKSQVVVMVDDKTNPLATTFYPNNINTVAVKPTLTVTFNEAINTVSGKKIRIFDASGGPSLDQIDASTGVQKGKQFSFTTNITLGYSKSYFVTIDAGAFKDIFGNPYGGLSSPTGWVFTTTQAPDTQAPVITYTPDKILKGSNTKLISVTITDNIAVNQAKIFYRSLTTNATLTSANLALDVPSSKWQVSLPESAFGPMGLEFYLTASDAASNSVQSPATGFHYMYFSYPTGSGAPTIPNSLVGQGGEVSGYRINHHTVRPGIQCDSNSAG